jgi:Reverse transcriptase (RNA-dependent DNA polymerase)
VDDLIFMGNNQRFIDEFKREMKLKFEMTDLGMMRYFLGPEIKQEKSGNICISRSMHPKNSPKVRDE